MTATRLDVVTRALRLIGIGGVGFAVSGNDASYAGDVLDAEYARLKAEHGFTWAWSPAANDIPDAYREPLVYVLASVVAPTYGISGPPYSRGVAALRALSFPDDREEPADTDDDGTVTTAEADAYARAQYY